MCLQQSDVLLFFYLFIIFFFCLNLQKALEKFFNVRQADKIQKKQKKT